MTEPANNSKSDGWKQIPPKPKVPNYWQGHGYTLVYVTKGGGWDVHRGTFSAKADVPEAAPLFHARKAADAKQWVADHPASGKPAPKPRASRAGGAKGSSKASTEGAK